MTSNGNFATEKELLDITWPLIAEIDLSSMTTRDIRLKVTEHIDEGRMLGGKEGKQLFRKVIETCLERRLSGVDSQEQEQRDGYRAGGQGEEKSKETEKSSKEPSGRKATKAEQSLGGCDVGNAEWHASRMGTGLEGSITRDSQLTPPGSGQNPSKKRRKLVLSDDESSGPDGSVGDPLTLVPLVKVKKPLQRASSGEKPKKRRATKSAPPPSKLAKVLRVARGLGCPVPPSRLRCEESEKMQACIKHLESKGIFVDVTKLTKDEISSMKAERERKAELDSLDISNIISSDQKRTRRRRGTLPVARVSEKPNTAGEGAPLSQDSSGEDAGHSESEFEPDDA